MTVVTGKSDARTETLKYTFWDRSVNGGTFKVDPNDIAILFTDVLARTSPMALPEVTSSLEHFIDSASPELARLDLVGMKDTIDFALELGRPGTEAYRLAHQHAHAELNRIIEAGIDAHALQA